MRLIGKLVFGEIKLSDGEYLGEHFKGGLPFGEGTISKKNGLIRRGTWLNSFSHGLCK